MRGFLSILFLSTFVPQVGFSQLTMEEEERHLILHSQSRFSFSSEVKAELENEWHSGKYDRFISKHQECEFQFQSTPSDVRMAEPQFLRLVAQFTPYQPLSEISDYLKSRPRSEFLIKLTRYFLASYIHGKSPKEWIRNSHMGKKIQHALHAYLMFRTLSAGERDQVHHEWLDLLEAREKGTLSLPQFIEKAIGSEFVIWSLKSRPQELLKLHASAQIALQSSNEFRLKSLERYLKELWVYVLKYQSEEEKGRYLETQKEAFNEADL